MLFMAEQNDSGLGWGIEGQVREGRKKPNTPNSINFWEEIKAYGR